MQMFSVVVAAMVLVAPSGPAAAETPLAAGKALATEQCSSCHAIGREDESRNPAAPPFRTLGARYPVEQLAEALAEGITTAHVEMPQVEWTPVEIEAFLAYLRSIQSEIR